MQPHVMEALDAWSTAWNAQQTAAQAAFTAAFPALVPAEGCPCSGPTLRWETPGEGAGRVCLDDQGRAAVKFENVPKAAVGAAMTETWGADWFDEGPGGFTEAEPGIYHYEDEQAWAEYEFEVLEDGTVTFCVAHMPVDDLVPMLARLEEALAEHRQA